MAVERGVETRTLEAFPAAAIRFTRVLERNRLRLAVENGLAPNEMRALFRVGEVGSITPKHLAEYMQVTTGSITGISDRLVERELMAREAHPNDRRSIYLTLTPAGLELIRALHDDFETMIADSTKSLTPQEVAAFTSALVTVSSEILSKLEHLDAELPE
ncbi:MAG: MarR family winged helix-turn-helix transcriptional regulator [Microbacteriaceae bacterium]